MGMYGIATIFENSITGYEFLSDNIPLHLSHVDSFEVELTAEQLAKKLSASLTYQKTLQVKVLRDACYGPEKDILVAELELTPDLSSLHIRIMDMLTQVGAIFKNPHFHNDGYSPHISIYENRRVSIGEVVTIDQVSIGSKVSDDGDAATRILATIDFKN